MLEEDMFKSPKNVSSLVNMPGYKKLTPIK